MRPPAIAPVGATLNDSRMAPLTAVRRSGVRFAIVDPRLLLWKSASVFALSFALLPLVALKSDVPAIAYAGSLVALHVVIVAIYLYRVRFRELDPDRRSLIARVGGLVLTSYLLIAASKFGAESSFAVLAAQMFVLAAAHLLMLLLMMVRVELAPAGERAPR